MDPRTDLATELRTLAKRSGGPLPELSTHPQLVSILRPNADGSDEWALRRALQQVLGDRAFAEPMEVRAARALLGADGRQTRGARVDLAAAELGVVARTVRTREPDLFVQLADVLLTQSDTPAPVALPVPALASPAVPMLPASLPASIALPTGLLPWWQAARGSDSVDEFRFTGRASVLSGIARGVETDGPGLCVVTGMPGAGKSAVLGALVLRSLWPEVLPSPLVTAIPDISVSAAVSASDATADSLLIRLAAALGINVPAEPIAARSALTRTLSERARRAVIVIDAVDEAQDYLGGVLSLVLELSRVAEVVIGVRPDDEGGLESPVPRALRALHPVVVDLDAEEHRSVDDVAAYVAGRLRDDPRAEGYAAAGWTRRLLLEVVGREIGRAADRNFLVAQFMTEEMLVRPVLADARGGWSADLGWPARVDAWMERDLERRAGDRLPEIQDLLRPLAHAEAGGLPVDVWADAATRFRGRTTSTAALDRVVRRFGFYLVADRSGERFALRHESFREHFRSGWGRATGARHLYEAVLASVPHSVGVRRWDRAPDYARRNLLTHAAAAGAVDELLEGEPACLAAVAADTAAAALAEASSPQARATALVFRRAAYGATGAFPERLATLGFHAVLSGHADLAERLRRGPVAEAWSAPWRAGGPPAAVPLQSPSTTWSVRPLRVDGRPAALVVDGSGSAAVRDTETLALLAPEVRIAPPDAPPSGITAWTGASGAARVLTWDETGHVRNWALTGPDATAPAVTWHLAAPVAQAVPVDGPRGVDLIWLVADSPPAASVWSPHHGADGPVFAARPYEGAHVEAVPRGSGSGRLVTANASGVVTAWSFPEDGEPLVAELPIDVGPVRGLRSRGDGDLTTVVVERRQGGIEVHWPGAEAPVALPTGGPLARFDVSAPGDEILVAGGDSDGLVRIWRVSPGEPPAEVLSWELGSAVHHLRFLDGPGRHLAVADWHGLVRVLAWGPRGADLLALLPHGRQVGELIPLGESGTTIGLATRALTTLTRFWRIGTDTPEASTDGAMVTAVAAVPIRLSADLVAAAAGDAVTLHILDGTAQRGSGEIGRVPLGERIDALAAAPDDAGGASVAAVGDDVVAMWRVGADGTVSDVVRVGTEEEPFEHAVWARTGPGRSKIVLGGPETLRVVDPARPGPGLGEHVLHEDAAVTSLTVVWAGRPLHDSVVVGTDDGLLHLLDPSGPKLLRTVKAGEPIDLLVGVHAAQGVPAVVAVGRTSVKAWDLAGVPYPIWRPMTEILHVAAVETEQQTLLVVTDITGALELRSLDPAASRPIAHVPGPGGTAVHLTAGPSRTGGTRVLAAYNTGRVLHLEVPARGEPSWSVLELNCDLSALAYAAVNGWGIGAFGAAIFALRP